MAASKRKILRSFFKLLFFPAQKSLNSYSKKPLILHFGCIYKHFCSKATSTDEHGGGFGSNGNENENCQETAGSKQLNLVVSSLRVDRVAATGFGIGRRKLDLLLLAGKLYLNKNKVEKRSLQVSCNDILELIAREQTDAPDGDSKVYLSRLVLNEIGETKTKKGNLRISLTRQRNIVLDRGSFNRIYRKKKYQ